MPSCINTSNYNKQEDSYSETVIFETTHFNCIEGRLKAWSSGATPEYYIKSKLNGKKIKVFGSQDMCKSQIEYTKKEMFAYCRNLEKTIF